MSRYQSNIPPSSRAFTIVELVVVVCVILVFAALAFPGLAGTRQRNKRMACLNNLRQMGGGSQMYAQDDSQSRLTGTLETSPAAPPGGDDGNLLHCFGPGLRGYISNTQNFFVPRHSKH